MFVIKYSKVENSKNSACVLVAAGSSAAVQIVYQDTNESLNELLQASKSTDGRFEKKAQSVMLRS